jgi:hypothetical protein
MKLRSSTLEAMAVLKIYKRSGKYISVLGKGGFRKMGQMN